MLRRRATTPVSSNKPLAPAYATDTTETAGNGSANPARSLFSAPEVGWAAIGAYVYAFGWVYTHAFYTAWGVTPEELGLNPPWIIMRAGLLFSILLVIIVIGLRADFPWPALLVVFSLAVIRVQPPNFVGLSLFWIILFTPTILVPLFWAAQQVVPGARGMPGGWIVPVLAGTIALLYVGVAAHRAGEHFREDGRPGLVSFFPSGQLPELADLVAVDAKPVLVSRVDGTVLGCAVLLGSSNGTSVVYDSRNTFRLPVDSFVVAEDTIAHSPECHLDLTREGSVR